MSTKTVKDPVCGMDVDPDKEGPHAEFQGTSYYFCSDHCKNKFIENPAAYVAGAKQVSYTCPMHPEIVEYQPGSCPKCGMALVSRKTG